MKKSVYLLIYLLELCFLILIRSNDKLSNSIIELNKTTFYELLESHNELNNQQSKQSINYLLVYFYAPWCSYCLHLSNELITVAEYLKDVNVYKIDMNNDENDEIILKEKIEGFPTINLYRNGVYINTYHGSRTSKDIIEYVNRKINTYSIRRVNTLEGVMNLVSQLYLPDNPHSSLGNEVLSIVFIAYPSASPQSDHGINGIISKYMNEIVKSFEIADFRLIDNVLLLQYFNILDDSLIVFNSIDNQIFINKYYNNNENIDLSNYLIHHTISLSIDDPSVSIDKNFITNELLKYMIPIVIPYNRQSQPLIKMIPIKTQVLIFASDLIDQSILIQYLIKPIKLLYPTTFIFILVDPSQYHIYQLFDISVDDNTLDVLIVNMSDKYNMKKYSYSKYLTNNEINNNDICLSTGVCSTSLLRNKDSVSQTDSVIVSPINSDINGVIDNVLDGLLDNKIIVNESIESNVIDIFSFFKDYISDNILRDYKSESDDDIELVNQQMGYNSISSIENINSNQFYDKVLLNPLNVLLYIHAPWCSHCKSIEPILEHVASVYSKMINDTDTPVTPTLVYRMDGSKNDIILMNLRIIGYPTIYFFKSNDKSNPIEYDGERTAEAMMTFIDLFIVN